jgi:hypothetical protein
VSGPHFYASALRHMRQTHGNCAAYVVIEDDVSAARGWKKSVLRSAQGASKLDSQWRAVRLFSPDVWTNWAPIELVGVFILCSTAAFFSFARCFFDYAGSRGSVLRNAQQQSPKFAVACRALCAGATLVFALWAFGLARMPCALNHLACTQLRGPLLGKHPQICTQAYMFAPASVDAFVGCLENTPVGDGACMRVDMAMHRCFAAHVGVPFSGFSALAAVEPPLLPCPARVDECAPQSDVTFGLYEAIPHQFQHTGIVNSGGQPRPLLVTDRWAGYAEGPLNWWALFP